MKQRHITLKPAEPAIDLIDFLVEKANANTEIPEKMSRTQIFHAAMVVLTMMEHKDDPKAMKIALDTYNAERKKSYLQKVVKTDE